MILYRYEDSLCMYDYSARPEFHLTLRKFSVIAETARGVWIFVRGKRKFVLLSGRRRFAYPTLDEAWDSFQIRKQHEKSHLTNAIDRNNAALRFIEGQECPPSKTIMMTEDDTEVLLGREMRKAA